MFAWVWRQCDSAMQRVDFVLGQPVIADPQGVYLEVVGISSPRRGSVSVEDTSVDFLDRLRG